MTGEEFHARLLANEIEAACPVCRKDDWRGVEDVVNLNVRGGGTLRYADSHARRAVEVIAPSCGHCGHVRIFDLHFFADG